MFSLLRKPTGIQHGLQISQQIRNSSNLVNLTINNEGIATVTMQRKPVNSFNLEMATELHKTLEQVEADKAKGMILTSGLDSVYSGGMDFFEMYKPEPQRAIQFWTTIQDLWLKLYGMAMPTVAVINGHAPATGCTVAMSCEYRIMVKEFTIGLNETRLGVVIPTWFTASMRNTVSQRHTELALSAGSMFNADEALAIGLVDEVVSDKDEAMARTAGFFKRFERVNPLARQMTKIACRKKDMEIIMDKRDEDRQSFLTMINNREFQNVLEMYMKSLRNK